MGDWQKGKRGGGGGGGGGGKRGRWHKPSSSSAAIPYGTRGVVVTCEQGKERAACRDVARALDEVFEAKFPSSAPPAAEANADEDPEARRRRPHLRPRRETRRSIPPTRRGGAATAQGGKVRVAAVRVPEPGLQGVRVRAHGRGFGSNVRALGARARVAREGARGEARRARGRGSRIRPKVAARPAARPGGRRVLRWFGGDQESREEFDRDALSRFGKNTGRRRAGEGKENVRGVPASRANSSVKRADAIAAVADLVPKGHAVDLTSPDLTIAVEVIKGTCCLSVLREYYGLLKYNWRMLGLSDEERAAERSRGTNGDDGRDARR